MQGSHGATASLALLQSRARASAIVAERFRARRDLDPARRRAIARTAYGLLRRARTLSFAADTIDGRPGDRAAILSWRARLDDRPDEAWAVLAPAIDAIDDPISRVATEGSLPDWLAGRLIADLGEPASRALARALSAPPPTDLRANRARGDRGSLIEALGQEGIGAADLPRTTNGIRLDDGAYDLFATRAHRDGRFEVQDEGSQLVAELVAPPPGGLIVDACAGEGGKTLAIASALGGRGRIVACDVEPRKLEVLRARAKRAGISNVQTVALESGGALPEPLRALVGRADRVLVDAPCSGVGSFRRNPEARARIEPDVPTRLSAIQREILDRFRALVAPGGRLIYATCTVLREENEAVVEALDRGDFVPMRAVEIWGAARATALTDETGTHLKLRPDLHGTDGFFATVLRRPRN